MKKLKLAEIEKIKNETASTDVYSAEYNTYHNSLIHSLADLALKQHAALKFYGNKNNWEGNAGVFQMISFEDTGVIFGNLIGGKRARQTLDLVDGEK